jgi:hypothetical protein
MKRLIWFLVAAAPYGELGTKHNLAVGGGVAMPGGELDPYLRNAPAMRFGYGFRFHRLFQADAGLDVGFGSARIKDFYESQFGELRIRDYQYMLPIGGRVVVPLADERVQLYAGGGVAWLVCRGGGSPAGQAIALSVRCAGASGWDHAGWRRQRGAGPRKMFRLG